MTGETYYQGCWMVIETIHSVTAIPIITKLIVEIEEAFIIQMIFLLSMHSTPLIQRIYPQLFYYTIA